MKNPLTPAGIEPATFRFVAQNFNHCATAAPHFVLILDVCHSNYKLPSPYWEANSFTPTINTSPNFTDTQNVLLCSQYPATHSYPQPFEFNPFLHYLFKIPSNFTLTSIPTSSKWAVYFRHCPPKVYMHFSPEHTCHMPLLDLDTLIIFGED